MRLWNSDTKKQISLTRLAERASSVAFTPDGLGLALGSESGELIVITYTVLSEAGGKEHSNDSAHSPPSSFAGATNGVQIEKQWQVVFRRHVAARTHIKPNPDAGKDAGDDGENEDDGDDGDVEEEEKKDKDRYEVNYKKSEVVELKYSLRVTPWPSLARTNSFTYFQ